MSFLSDTADFFAPGAGVGVEGLETLIGGAPHRVQALSGPMEADQAYVIRIISASRAGTVRAADALKDVGAVCSSLAPAQDPAGLWFVGAQFTPHREHVGASGYQVRAALREASGEPTEIVLVWMRDSATCRAANFYTETNDQIFGGLRNFGAGAGKGFGVTLAIGVLALVAIMWGVRNG